MINLEEVKCFGESLLNFLGAKSTILQMVTASSIKIACYIQVMYHMPGKYSSYLLVWARELKNLPQRGQNEAVKNWYQKMSLQPPRSA